MLIVNGALAVWNGLLVATGKFWCECVRGGTCCGGECRCDEGVCCGDVWFPDDNPNLPCQEGEFFLQWGENNACCGCVPDTIFDGRVGDFVNTADVADELCCPTCGDPVRLPYDESQGYYTGCLGRCCDQTCTHTLQENCQGDWHAGCCESRGCPKSCCGEGGDGIVFCDTVGELECGGIVDPEPCETACKGACCIDGELVETSPMTQADCDSVGGCWKGIGSTDCGGEAKCRAPFDGNCCETVTSSASRLTFHGPRKKRCPELDGCGFQVTVSVTTSSPVYVHGNLFGSPYESCTDTVSFFLCNDEFHVTPAPCSGNLQNLNIEVCWDDTEAAYEVLRFQCCQNITYLLGNSDCDCVTTLLYEGDGCTSNASLVLRGDAIIEANGTGPLVLTTQVNGGTGEKSLRLRGANDDANTIGRISGQNVSVIKDGPGLWRLNAAKAFGGTLTLNAGTLKIAHNGAAGSTVIIGDADAGGISSAKFLLEQGITVSTSFDVLASAGFIMIGCANTSGTSTYSSGEIRMGRSVTLVAATGGSVDFSNTWAGPTSGSQSEQNVTIGAPGYAGHVMLFNATLSTTGTVAMEYGTITLGFDTTLESPYLTLGSAEGPITFDLGGGTARHGSVLFVGGGNMVINTETEQGVLRLDNDGSNASVTTTVSGNEIEADVSLDDHTDFTISGGLEISGDISGDSGITKNGNGTLTLSGALSYGGTTNIVAGSVVTQTLVSGPAKFASATFTPTGLTVSFSSAPASGEQYRLLPGATAQTYETVTLTGAGSATATYDSSTSTLTIA